MNRRLWTYVFVSLFLPLQVWAKINNDQQVNGSLETGFWYVANDVSAFAEDGASYTSQDNYGETYVQDSYMLFHARLKLDTGKKRDPFRFHTQTRFLYNLKDRNYTLGINERYRYQFNELNVELNEAIGKSQIFLGRKTNYQVGGIGVDGLTMIFNPKETFDIGLYAGLGVDPRQFTGYIGPNYRENPINPDFLTGGLFTSVRVQKLTIDFAVNSLFHEFSLDRLNVFTQWMAQLHEKWNFSGLLDVGAAGDTGLVQAQAFVHTKVTAKITNQLGYHRYRSVFFDQSDASGIPVPASINPNFSLGDAVNTTYYQTFSNHTKFKLEKNYFFTRVSFSKRAFDDLKRKTFSIGYRDPHIRDSAFSATLKTTLIDNYKSYHAITDLMVGMDIIEQRLEFEIGGSISHNQRQAYQNFVAVDGQFETEQESVLRANMIFQPTLKMAWYIQYRLYNQVDAVNND
ncbi:MAG: hypothetical protein KDK51_09770, partial [Deltaproteobacteria bacterium]|nr:hypothetical protein [Deltaproteobacteria bacterium]